MKSVKALDRQAWSNERLASSEILEWTTEGLLALCEVDTTLRAQVQGLAAAEQACFSCFRRAVEDFMQDSHEVIACPVDPAIARDEDYTIPHYAGDLAGSPERVYAGRHNWLMRAKQPISGGPRWLLNAHVDTAPPHIPPRRRDDVIAGRGASDNKGGMMVMAVLARLLGEWGRHSGEHALDRVDFSVSIDEEMGGNGTLALLPHLPQVGLAIVVLEPTRLRVFPANRGALWFQVRVRPIANGLNAGAHLAAACVVRALHKEGLRIRSDFPHPFFDPEDVQTCFGIMGSFGRFPASACESVTFALRRDAASPGGLKAELERELAEVARPAQLKIECGIRSVRRAGDAWLVEVGSTGGHMGSRSRDTDAITKAAYLMERLESRHPGSVEWLERNETFMLDGGQGFLPSMTMAEVRKRLSDAARRALSEFPDFTERYAVEMTFDKIHNAAYCSDPNARGAALLQDALRRCFPDKAPPPLRGWQASCDARLFARISDDVVTFGAGSLDTAHGPDEEIAIRDILNAAGVLFCAITEARSA